MNLQDTGRDIAKFTIIVPGLCEVCGMTTGAVVRWDTRSLRRALYFDYDVEKGTIAHNPNKKGTGDKTFRDVGITCGCYGKFHRQLAHIADRRKNKAPS